MTRHPHLCLGELRGVKDDGAVDDRVLDRLMARLGATVQVVDSHLRAIHHCTKVRILRTTHVHQSLSGKLVNNETLERWEVGGGRWEVGGGRWKVGSGRWEVGGGRW